MTDISEQAMLAAPGRERPDYTIFDFPDASLTDTSIEEIEFDQALSLAGRFGRDFLGVVIDGILDQMGEEHLTVGGSDHEQTFSISLGTRTGAFRLGDPELIWLKQWRSTAAAGATDTATVMLDPSIAETRWGEPFLYVAPRLFWRLANNGDQTIAIGDFDARIGSMSVKLNFQLFIELLERFADVTLL